MRSKLLAASAAVLVFAAGASAAQAPPTAAEAKAFVEQAESQLAGMNEYAARAGWVRANFLTGDTQWLEAKATAEQNQLATGLAKQAARFNGVAVDPVTARKLKLLKLYLTAPAPARPGAAAGLAKIAPRLDSTYSTGKFTYQGKTLTLDDAEKI